MNASLKEKATPPPLGGVALVLLAASAAATVANDAEAAEVPLSPVQAASEPSGPRILAPQASRRTDAERMQDLRRLEKTLKSLVHREQTLVVSGVEKRMDTRPRQLMAEFIRCIHKFRVIVRDPREMMVLLMTEDAENYPGDGMAIISRRLLDDPKNPLALHARGEDDLPDFCNPSEEGVRVWNMFLRGLREGTINLS